MNQKPRAFADRYPAAPAASPATLDFFFGTLRRRWPTLGLHAWVQEASYGKGRLLTGPIDSMCADATY